MTKPEVPQVAIDAAMRAETVMGVLEAAAPHIGAAYLRDAAKQFPNYGRAPVSGHYVKGWLNQLADRIEAGDE